MELLWIGILVAGCVGLLVAEKLGVRTTLNLEDKLKGDVKRESRWLAQYGQSVCTPVAGVLVMCLDKGQGEAVGVRRGLVVIGAVVAASVVCMLMKRVLGRIRPGRGKEGEYRAGEFTGPSWKHANYRESFPSSHSACAVALSVVLSAYYPGGAGVFWGLAVACAVLRYVLDAHFPSDVLGGVALGWGVGLAAVSSFRM